MFDILRHLSTKLIFVGLTFLLATLTLKAQDMFFSGLSVGDGLSQYTVRGIVQDRNGLLWLATTDGLSRYDGNDFSVFRHNPADSTSIADSRINTISSDDMGRVWTGTSHWLSVYDDATSLFHNYPAPASVSAISGLGPDKLLVGTSKGLYVYCITSHSWEICLKDVSVICIRRATDSVFIGLSDGYVYQMNPNTCQCRTIPGFKATNSVQDLYLEGPERLWIATEGAGLVQIDGTGNILHTFNTLNGLASDYVRSLATDSFGRLWVGTVNGLDIIADGHIHHEVCDPFRSGSLSHNSVRCIFRDNQDGMWLGTFYGGVNYWHSLRNHFGNIVRQQDGKSLSHNIISCIVEDGDKVWIGTNGGGVNLYDRRNGSVRVVPTFIKGQDSFANDIKAIYASSGDGYVYIGSHSGSLKRLKRSDFSVSRCDGAPKDVYCLLPLSDGLLLGCLGGLYRYDFKSNSCASLELGFGRVWALASDATGRIWVSTDAGVRVINIGTDGKVREEQELSKALSSIQKAVCIHISGISNVWMATQEGVVYFNAQDGGIKTYTVVDGLPGNVTHGIEEDDWGRFWISTDRGLCCLNPFTGQIRSYTDRDGLSSSQFSDYSHCRMSDGEMWFGGMNGINYFKPEKFADNPYSPKPLITSVMVNEERMNVSEGRIKLPYTSNSLDITFAVPNYLAWGENRFRYTLEGFSNAWQNAGTDRRAVYSNLPPGHYMFKVQSANNDGLWCEEMATVAIRICPKWSQTIAARLAFTVLGIVLLMLAFWFVSERNRLRLKIEQEEKDKARQEEMMQMKTRFFINMSHELRNPLQLILAPISEMQQRSDDRWMKKQLRYLDRNANRLLHLVNQLMDYRRAELGVFKLHVRPENVHKIIRDNFGYFENTAASKHLSFELESQLEGMELLCDDQYIELILNNLLSNAFKYTDRGSVKVKAWVEETFLKLSVADTGVGVAKEEQDRIFERFYQADGKHIGSGIGLSLVQRLVELHHGTISLDSELGRGSVFTISIPTSPDAYSEDELNSAKEEQHSVNSGGMIAQDSLDVNEKEAVNATPDRPMLLIVEDDAEIRDYLEQGMEKRFRTETVSNGQEAVAKLSEGHFDLVVTDVNMPVMNGRQLCEWIRHNPDTSNLSVVVISSLAGEEAQLELLHSGADDYVTKPFSVAVLSAKLSNLMKSKKKLQASIAGKAGVEESSLTYNPADEDFLEKAMRVIGENISNVDFSTEDLAAAMNMSRSNLHLKVKAITGSSALELIRKLRFEKACQMLEQGRWTISEIADSVGFASSSYFTTSFKKQMGCLPSEYVRKQSPAPKPED